MQTNSSKQQRSFVYGAALLAFAHIVIKVIGALFKIPLDTMILHTEGMGIYNSAYTIYNWLYIISTAGIPVAISKLVSAAGARDNEYEADCILLVSKRVLVIMGAALSAVMFFGADLLARLLNAPSAAYALRALSPALLFVSVVSVYRGYSQGYNNMLPTALSEIAEAIGKLVFGLGLGYLFLNTRPDEIKYAAAGAIGGVSTGTFLAFMILALMHWSFKTKRRDVRNKKPEFSKPVLKELVKIALPITLSASVFTLTALIDTAINMNVLSQLGYTEAERLSMTGYLGRAVTMFNVAPTVIAAIAVSIVPVISAALARNNRDAAAATAVSALRMTAIFIVPCAFGLSVLAKPILGVIYNDSAYNFLLSVMGLAVMFVGMVQIENAVLQAYGSVWKPVINMGVGGVVKIIVNLLLISRPEINIYGAPVGTLACYVVIMLLNYRSVKKAAGKGMSLVRITAGPLACSALMAVCAGLGFNALSAYASSEIIVLALSIVLAVAVYFTAMFLVRAIKKDDILLFPGGEKIYKKLIKFGIMKGMD